MALPYLWRLYARNLAPDTVQRSASCNVEGLIVGPSEGHVGWRFGELEGAQVPSIGVHHPETSSASYIDRALDVDLHTVGITWLVYIHVDERPSVA